MVLFFLSIEKSVDFPLLFQFSYFSHNYNNNNNNNNRNYGQYINQFPPNTIKVIQEFERIQKKICRHKMSIMFNEICINEEMLPKYTYFKLHDPAAHKYNSTLEYRRDLVKRQITLCKNNIHSLHLESSTAKMPLHSSNMIKQKLHHFCNRSSPDDGPKSGRKY